MMTGRHRLGVRAFACACFVSSLAMAPASAAGIGCGGLGEPFAIVQAVGARDAVTILLSDGREVRLAGVAVPALVHEAAGPAKDALHALVAGRPVALHGAGNPDRYGRLTADVMVAAGDRAWVQDELVRLGMAYAAPGSSACAPELIARERAARRQGAGLWGAGALSVMSAAASQPLPTNTGDFAVVEGRVVRVGEGNGRIFLDFGRRFDRDFSLVVPREAQASFAKAGLDLRALSGKRVRVRGVLFEQGGPAMELRSPAALEVIGADGA
jgi:endonuclease YncB( thermonuclease family)